MAVEKAKPATKPAAPTKPAPVVGGKYIVQVGAFSSESRANAAAKSVGGTVSKAGNLWRVRIGPFASDADARGATELLERVRASVEAMEIDAGGSLIRVTVSIGQALGEPGEPVERTLERADQALYRAKERGRNQVAHDGEAPEEAVQAVVVQWPYI